MAHKTEGECPIAVSIFIRKQAEKYNMPITKAIKDYSNDSGTPEATVSNWVYPRKGKVDSNATDKPPKKQTKPEAKIQLDSVKKVIADDNATDDDIKKVMDVVADKITNGTCAKRVGTKVATAVKKASNKKGAITAREVDNFRRLKKHVISCIDGLTFWADNTMQPETADEAECAKIIIASAANMVVQFARLGVDVQGIYQTFIEGDQNETAEQEYNRARKVN